MVHIKKILKKRTKGKYENHVHQIQKINKEIEIIF